MQSPKNTKAQKKRIGIGELLEKKREELTRAHIIRTLLEEKREKLYPSQNKSGGAKRSSQKTKAKTSKDIEVIENEIDSNDLPPEIRLLHHGKIPEISNRNWKIFKKDLESKEPNPRNQVIKCLDKMHGSYRKGHLHFTNLHFIRKAIVDSLLRRKWDNLVKLLVLLIQNYMDPVFTIFIRHMCEILKHYHPQIRGTKLEDQIELIMEKHEQRRIKQQQLRTGPDSSV